MYVRVTGGTFELEREAEVLQVIEERLVPAFKQLPGFRDYIGALDREAGRHVTITTWETEAQAKGLREAISDVVSQLRAAGVELEPPAIYEVVAQAGT